MKDITKRLGKGIAILGIVLALGGASYLAGCGTEQAKVNSGARYENGRIAPRDGHHTDCQYRHTNNKGLECYR